MGILTYARERRAAPLFDHDLLAVELSSGGRTTRSGARVDELTALKYSVVYSCIALITETISTLDIGCYQRVPEEDRLERRFERDPMWLKRNADKGALELHSETLVSLLLWGDAFRQKIRRPSDQQLIGLRVIEPWRVEVDWDEKRPGFRKYRIDGGQWQGEEYVDHIMGLGPPNALRGWSVIGFARESIGLALSTEEFGASFFGQGSASSRIVIEAPGKPDEKQMELTARSFERAHRGRDNWHRPGVLTGGAKATLLTIPPNDAQFLETREFQALDVARWFRVPPHRVNVVSKETSWGSGLEEQNRIFLQTTLRPWLTRLERSYSLMLPGGPDTGLVARFDTSDLSRGSLKEQFDAWGVGVDKGILVPNEPRRWMGLKPIEGGDEPRPAPNAPGEAQGPQPANQNSSSGNGQRHMGPGPHPSGTPQSVHGGGALTLRHPSAAERAELADQAAAGGFTYDPSTGLSPTTGCAVSPYPERSRLIDADKITGDHIGAYVTDNRDLLGQPDHMLGAWNNPDDAKVYLDVVVVKPRSEAIELGIRTNQIGVWDLGKQEFVATGGTGEAA